MKQLERAIACTLILLATWSLHNERQRSEISQNQFREYRDRHPIWIGIKTNVASGPFAVILEYSDDKKGCFQTTNIIRSKTESPK